MLDHLAVVVLHHSEPLVPPIVISIATMASEGNQPEIIVKEEPDAETENGVDPNNKVNVKIIF